MPDLHFPQATRAHAERRHALAPAADDAFRAFSKAVFAEGALDARTKQIIAVAVAHVTQCPWCIEGHVRAARRAGAGMGSCRRYVCADRASMWEACASGPGVASVLTDHAASTPDTSRAVRAHAA